MRVDQAHLERAAGVAKEAMRKAVAAGVDQGALATAFFGLAIDTMAAMDGPSALRQALREYCEAFDRRETRNAPRAN